MTLKSRVRWAGALLLVGGVISFAWAVTSILALFDVVSDETGLFRSLRAIGPLGIVLVILGGVLCRFNLPALRRKAAAEAESGERGV